MIDVEALGAIRAVGVLGSLAKAAEELSYTPSAISQRIKRLERDVGVPLLAPAGRGVVLTAAGRAMVDAAPEVFSALERCTQIARSVAEAEPFGILRIASFPDAIPGLLVPVLGRLSRRHPDLILHISEHDTRDAVHAVESGNADLALAHDEQGAFDDMPSFMIRRHVRADIVDAVMTRQHPLARLDGRVGPGDLARHPCITGPEGTISHRWLRELFADSPEEPVVRHLVDGVAAQLAVVESGSVVALVPRLGRPSLGPDLVAVPVESAPTREVYAVWRRSADASPAIRAAVNDIA